MRIFLIINLIVCVLFFSAQSSYGQERLSPPARLQVDLLILDIFFSTSGSRYAFSDNAGVVSRVKDEDLVGHKRKYLHDLLTRHPAGLRRNNQIVLEFEKNEYFLGTNRTKDEQSIPATIRFMMDFLALSLWGWSDNDFFQ